MTGTPAGRMDTAHARRDRGALVPEGRDEATRCTLCF
jgi:hypothetical protein